MVKEQVRFPKKESIKFCLVGSGKILTSFAKMLLDNNFPSPILVTWKKSLHQRDFSLLTGNNNYENMFDFAENNKLNLIEANNINDISLIKELKREGVNVIFSISSRWIFREKIISSFEGLTINIHGGYLPRDKGSVIYSKLLNNSPELGATIHLISPEVDAGPILFRVKKNVKINTLSIDEVTKIIQKLSINLLKKFLTKLENNEPCISTLQNNDEGIYMPQLYTEINGYIDWKWKLRHIESFIRAFGRPMPGAMTFYKNKKIKILDAYTEESSIEFHPLYFGRIVSINQKGYARIATEDGYLIITKIEYDNSELLPEEILRAPNVLHTPIDLLEQARVLNKSSLEMEPPS